MTIGEKHENLKACLRDLGNVAIAFSGGVDSTLLLAAAHEVLGDRVIAVTVDAPQFPRRELDEARIFCDNRGIVQIICEMDMIVMPPLAQNPPNRCYLCKKAILMRLWEAARERGIAHLADGSNADDDSDERPGMKAAAELGVISPLRRVGLAKDEIRSISQAMGLAAWDKPAFACLATRLPHGVGITMERLLMIERAEQFLWGNGFRQIRVRCHGDLARIETDDAGFAMLMAEGTRGRITAGLREAGFRYIALDLLGYRAGSMGEAL